MASSNNKSESLPNGLKLELTKTLASFISSTTYASIPPSITTWLKVLLLDYIGVASFAASRAESSEPFYNAVRMLYPAMADNDGNNYDLTSVIAQGHTKLPPQSAALLNGAFAHTLDFDDTHLAGVVHPGASVISAALAEAERLSASGETLLAALAVGYEVVCRLGLVLGTGGFVRGFHNTATAGIFGGIAAIGKLRGLDAHQIESAFGIGVSRAAGSMQYLQNGAWNKRLHPGFAAHDAFFCVAFAQAGVLAAEKPIEGDHGVLAAYSASTNDYSTVVDGLGTTWVLGETAIKPYPACRFAHAGIDLAAKMRCSNKNASAPGSDKEKGKNVKSFHLELSLPYFELVGTPLPNKVRPHNIVDAQFSAYYQVAVTWLHGAETGWGIYDRLSDQDVEDLLGRVSVSASDDLSNMQARLTVQYVDGGEEMEFLEAPLGELSNPMPLRTVHAKFTSLAEPVYGREGVQKIKEAVESIERSKVNDLMNLVA